MHAAAESERHIGLLDAVGVGVGAIVGGGILALAGAAFSATGPSAILAFGLNGLIALLTALSFAEVSTKFPRSGGTYAFAKRVLSVEAAFGVGWVVWFASLLAAVLYALGFGQFAAVAIAELAAALGMPGLWATERPVICALAIAAILVYTVGLWWKSAGGGAWANIGKVVVFAILIVCGLWALRGRSAADVGQALQPFFAAGVGGLVQAMGFTFIALQGFDLIAAVAGEIRQPERTIPRAMFGSLGLAILIYLPLLFVIATVGMPIGQSVTEVSRADPEVVVASAARNYLGAFGYWLVIVAAILSMLSALQANLFAASRVVMAMATDRTLPRVFARISPRSKTPRAAIAMTAILAIGIVLVLPGVAAAGAASSLIFLVSFTLVHWIAILVRRRSARQPPPFRTPLFPLVPVLGGLACVALAVFQGFAVPSAGVIAIVWLAVGGLLFLFLLARHARIADASLAASDPELVRLRGHSPLVLVPMANPDNARGLVAVANALAPPEVGRVLLLSVVVAPRDWRPSEDPRPLLNTQAVLREAIAASVEAGLFPESLTTVAPHPWKEIGRVAKVHRCESLLLGLSQLTDKSAGTPLDELLSGVDCDVVVLRAPKNWRVSDARRILIPTAGRGGHDRLLARLLSSLSRSGPREILFLRVVGEGASPRQIRTAERGLHRIADALGAGDARVLVASSKTPIQEVAANAGQADLLILGVQRIGRRQKLFGPFVQQIARMTSCPLLLICRGR